MSSGSKPVTTIGTRYRSASGGYSRGAHHAAHVPGGQERLHPAGRRLHDRLDRRRHQHVRDQQREVRDAQPLGLVDRHRVGRRGGLEADAEEHHLRSGFSRASLQRVQRRVDDPHVAARALDPEQVLARCPAPAACRRRSRRSRPAGAAISSALSMISSGVTQTGQPGPWIISISSGSSWSMPCRMIEWVWPPQTSIIAHGRGHRGVDVVEQPPGQLGVAELVEVLHRAPPSRRPSPACVGRALPGVAELLLELAESRRSSSSVSSADSSSSRCSANPTWTMMYSPTCEVGHVLQAHLLAHAAEVDLGHPGAVAVLDVRAPCRVPLGTWASPRVSLVARSTVAGRPTISWPSARPPSLGGTRRWRSTREAVARAAAAAQAAESSALGNTPPVSATVSSPCRSARQRADPAHQAATRAVEARRDQRRPDARAHVGDDRREHRAPGRRTAPALAGSLGRRAKAYAAVSAASARAARPALQLDRRPAPRSRRGGTPRRARTPRRRAGPCWRSARSPGRRSNCRASSRSSSGGQARDARQVRGPRRRRPPAGGPAPSGTGGARRRRRRAAGRSARCADRGEAVVVGEQHLAAPDGAVVAVAGAVEGDADHRRGCRRARARPSPRRCARGGAARVRTGRRAALPVGPPRRSGSRDARSATSGLGPHPGERSQVRRGAVEGLAGWRGRPCRRCAPTARRSGPRRGRRCSSGRRRRRAPAARAAAARAAAGRSRASGGSPAARPSQTRTTESSHGHVDRPVVRAARRRPGARAAPGPRRRR